MYTKQTPYFEYSTDDERLEARNKAIITAQRLANITQMSHHVFRDTHGGYKAGYAVFECGKKLPPFGSVTATINPNNS